MGPAQTTLAPPISLADSSASLGISSATLAASDDDEEEDTTPPPAAFTTPTDEQLASLLDSVTRLGAAGLVTSDDLAPSSDNLATLDSMISALEIASSVLELERISARICRLARPGDSCPPASSAAAAGSSSADVLVRTGAAIAALEEWSGR